MTDREVPESDRGPARQTRRACEENVVTVNRRWFLASSSDINGL